MMKALVLKEPKNIELVSVPKPVLNNDQVLIKVMACGICGSDLRYWYGENPWALHTLGEQVKNPESIILGHEYVGEVVESGSSKFDHLIGRRVGVQPWKACGVCEFCKRGSEHLCKKTIHTGHAQGWEKMDYYPGAYAEYCQTWGDFVYPLADSVSYTEASLADILGVALHVVNKSNIHYGDSVISLGGGPAGLLCCLLALSRGAKKGYILEKSPVAKEVLKHYAPNIITVPANPAELMKIANEASNISAVYDTIGVNEFIYPSLKALSEEGTYINMALHDTDISFNALALGAERSVISSSNTTYQEYAETFEIINSQKLDLLPIITNKSTFETFMDHFNLLLKDPKEAYKQVLYPWGIE
jgi:threonine dehydrogenase-like Zn-dependent dehydrogenase